VRLLGYLQHKAGHILFFVPCTVKWGRCSSNRRSILPLPRLRCVSTLLALARASTLLTPPSHTPRRASAPLASPSRARRRPCREMFWSLLRLLHFWSTMEAKRKIGHALEHRLERYASPTISF
jgi:hypothetical protein